MDKKPEKRRYILELTEEQAQMLSNASEFMTRIAMGQFQEISSKIWFQWEKQDTETAYHLLELAKKELTGSFSGSFMSITSTSLPDRFNVLWDLHQVIRYRLAWDRNIADSWDVHKDEPMKSSSSPLAKITKVED